MEKKRVIVTKYNMRYFNTEITETFEEYIKTLESKNLLPNECSIEFVNAKYKKVIINDNDTYQTFITENAKLNKIRAFIIEHSNNTKNIRKAKSEKLFSKQIFDKIVKKEKKREEAKRKKREETKEEKSEETKKKREETKEEKSEETKKKSEETNEDVVLYVVAKKEEDVVICE